MDQSKLRAAHVLVVGAGALGNEIVKSLALLGVGEIGIVDMDVVEHSNLARCVLFRDTDEGSFKAVVAAAAASTLNPDVRITAHVAPVQRLGLAHLARADLVIAGLDNREARLWVGQACRKLGLPWVDGAIEGLRGLARVFLPDGACYECTLGETDRRILAQRRVCALLSAEEMAAGKAPTNATTASIIAAVEVQEAGKLLVGRHDLLALANSALVYTGETLETYHVSYTEDEFCPSHDRYGQLVHFSAAEATLADVAAEGEALLGARPDAVELEDDLIVGSRCPGCETSQDVLRVRGSLRPGDDGECQRCGTELALDARRALAPDDPALATPLAELGLVLSDVVTVRSGAHRVHFSITIGEPAASGTGGAQ